MIKSEQKVRRLKDNYLDLGQRIEDLFADIENDIIRDLRENREEYKILHRQIIDLKTQYPFINTLRNGTGEIHLTADEHTILAEFLRLQFILEDMERQHLYFRGHTDAMSYLKKIGAI